ncbi:hypothetical protein FF011L_43420 [Roseimaritima multifibrata]|uniref:Uncharacterized protein n=1 Tax=Roseimaritima multifibrata TaxID=1930274 RepID=A0A517MKX6_9BACT|nr:hypothetical protein FF011L_43420 [Roseimaritima multifibrata]
MSEGGWIYRIHTVVSGIDALAPRNVMVSADWWQFPGKIKISFVVKNGRSERLSGRTVMIFCVWMPLSGWALGDGSARIPGPALTAEPRRRYLPACICRKHAT